jgi:hypothetical protein
MTLGHAGFGLRSMTARKLCATAIFALGLIPGGAAAQQEAIDMHLEDVGFVMRAAKPAELERLRSLPPRRFVARTIGGRRYYLYSDPDLCKCVFLGDEAAMQSYKDLIAAAAASNAANAANAAAQTPAGKVLIEEMDDGLNRSIAPGDILDY